MNIKTDIIEKAAVIRATGTTLFTIRGTLWEFQQLPDEIQAEFFYEALVNITCRTGKANSQKWSGIVNLETVGAWLATTTTRSGEPTAEDVKDAAGMYAELEAEAKKAYPQAEGISAGETAELRLAFIDKRIAEVIEKNNGKYNLAIEILEDESRQSVLARIVRGSRLAIEARARLEKKSARRGLL